jgi:hypothetical protein
MARARFSGQTINRLQLSIRPLMQRALLASMRSADRHPITLRAAAWVSTPLDFDAAGGTALSSPDERRLQLPRSKPGRCRSSAPTPRRAAAVSRTGRRAGKPLRPCRGLGLGLSRYSFWWVMSGPRSRRLQRKYGTGWDNCLSLTQHQRSLGSEQT